MHILCSIEKKSEEEKTKTRKKKSRTKCQSKRGFSTIAFVHIWGTMVWEKKERIKKTKKHNITATMAGYDGCIRQETEVASTTNTQHILI